MRYYLLKPCLRLIKSFMFSRFCHLLLQIASTVPLTLTKTKTKTRKHIYSDHQFLGLLLPLNLDAYHLLCACLSFGWLANIFTITLCDCNKSQGVGTSRLSFETHFQLWIVEGCSELHFWILKHF